MRPVVVHIPALLVKIGAIGLFAWGLFGVAMLLVAQAKKNKPLFERFRTAAPYSLVAAVAIVKLAGNSWAFWDPATYAAAGWASPPIFSYGTMLGISLFVGWYLTLGLGEKDGLPRETMANCFVVTAISAIVGARVLHFVTNPSELRDPLDFFKLTSGGLVAYGGFLGGFFASTYYLRKRGISLLAWADVAVPALATGLAITRWGCFLYGCDFGRPTKSIFGVRFPHWADDAGSPAWIRHVDLGLVERTARASLPVHPTQIYESIDGMLLFGLCMLVRKHRTFRGQVFLVFTMAYGVTRSLIETLRDDPERGFVGVFSTSQAIGLTTTALALWAYLHLRKRATQHPDRAMPLGPALDAAPEPARRKRGRK